MNAWGQQDTARSLDGVGRLTAASALAAVLGWLVLLAAARLGGPAEYAAFSATWALYFAAASVLIGFQQEVTRVVFRPESPSVGPRLVTVCLLTAIGAAPVLVAGAVFSDQFASVGGARIALTVVAGASFLICAAAATGVLVSEGRWTLLAVMIVSDQTLRLGAVLWVFRSSPGTEDYVIAIAAGTACFVPLFLIRRRILSVRVGVGPRLFLGRAAAAMASTGCAGVLTIGVPFLVTATGIASDHEAGVLFAALVLTRAPLLMVMNAVRPVLLRHLLRRPPQVLSRALTGRLILGAMGAAGVGHLLGPWLLRTIFGAEFEISGPVMGALVVCGLLHLALTATGIQLAVAGHDAASTIGWLLAVSLTVLCLLIPLGLHERTILALGVGALAGLVAHGRVLIRDC